MSHAQVTGNCCFFPELNAWIDAIDDPRFPPLVIYHKRFLLWWGLALFLCKLGSRRQLDYALNGDGLMVARVAGAGLGEGSLGSDITLPR